MNEDMNVTIIDDDDLTPEQQATLHYFETGWDKDSIADADVQLGPYADWVPAYTALSGDVARALKDRATRDGIPEARIINEAVNKYLQAA